MIRFSQKQKKVIAEQICIALDRELPGKRKDQRLAELVGVSPPTVLQWKKGTKTPNLQHLFELSKALNTPIHILCGFPGRNKIHSDNLIFRQIISLSVIGELLEKQGAKTPTTRRKLNQIQKALEMLEKTGMNSE